jgi:hypothetical protein
MRGQNGPQELPLTFFCVRANWPRHDKAYGEYLLLLLWVMTCFKPALTRHSRPH